MQFNDSSSRALAERKGMVRITKGSIGELAVYGGPCLFEQPLHVGAPNIGDIDCLFELIRDIARRRWLTNNGVCVQELEARIAQRLGVRNCVAVCNGTTALQLSLMALGIKGEVILPSFTFVATPNAVVLSGGKPVFCDVRSVDHNIDVHCVESLICPQTEAIIGVHIWGNPCQTKELERLAKDHGLKLIYDASHAFDCPNDGKMIGHSGNAEVFSFHATKYFNTCEGGAIVTNDDEIASTARRLRNFGISPEGVVSELGLNGKMSELSAAMGLVNLDEVDSVRQNCNRVYRSYADLIERVPGLEIYRFDQNDYPSCHYIPIRVTEDFGISRDDLMRILHAENVIVQRYFYPGCHRTPFYQGYNRSGLPLPVTEQLVKEIMVLPSFPSVREEDVRSIVQLLRLIQENASDISKVLPITV